MIGEIYMLSLIVDFCIPDYVLYEIDEYIKFYKKGKIKFSRFDNIIALIHLAVINNRITKEQSLILIEKLNTISPYN